MPSFFELKDSFRITNLDVLFRILTLPGVEDSV